MSVLVHGAERSDDGLRPDVAGDAGRAVVRRSDGRAPGRRRPVFVHAADQLARLVVSVALFVVLVVVVRVFDETVDGLGRDLATLARALPAGAAPVLDAVVITGAVLLVVAAAAAAVVRGGLRLVVTLAAAVATASAVVGAALAVAEARGWIATERPAAMVAAAAVVAALVVVHEQVPAALLRAGWWVLVPLAVVSSAWTLVPVGAELLALTGATAVASGIALAAGTPSRAPGAGELAEALLAAGLPVEEVWPASVDARASVPWRARLVTGRELFVKTRSSTERSADLLFRMWRVVRLRRPGDRLPDATLRRAVEHEAFVATRAAGVGVRTPRLVALGRLDDGMFAAYDAVAGTTVGDLGEDVPPAALRAVWSMMRTLHRAGIAHRDLRVANLLVDEEGAVWMVDFGFAELAATEEQLRQDVVELLASTAGSVGIGPAVEAAVGVMGHQAVAEALPLVQPAAVCRATRQALGRDGFAQLRRALVEATGTPEPDEPRLERLSPRTVLTFAALGVAVWLLLPQVAASGDLWTRIGDAHLGWVLGALVVSALTYVAATVSLLGAVPSDVPAGATLAAQVATSFTNRITPANLGGFALNTRFLARAGTGTAPAATAVGLSTTAGGAVHVVLVVFALTWAGTAGLGDLSLPSPRTLALSLAIVVVVMAAGLSFAGPRAFVVRRLAAPARQSWQAACAVACRPRRLAMLFGGSLFVTVGNVAALVLALAAFGPVPALSAVAVVYLAGSTIGSAAPTPGGLGATEAALVAGLTAVSVGQGEAVAAVLLFRLATFWLPILPGWLCLAHLQRRGYL